MKIIQILRRLDQKDIQDHFVSSTALDVLEVLQNNTSNPVNLLSLISKGYPIEEMLRNKKIRDLFISTLRENEAYDLSNLLGLKIFEQQSIYEQLKHVPFSSNSSNESILFEFFEEELPLNSDKMVQIKDIETTNIQKLLFDYQRKAIKSIMVYLTKNKKRCLLHMPTGSGKTTTAMQVVASFFITSTPTLVVWLAYNEELCEQALQEFKETWNRMGNRQLKIYRFFKNYSPDLINLTKKNKEGLIIAGLNKMYESEKKQNAFLTTLSDRVNLVVIDEAHQAPAPTYKDLLQILVDKHVNSTSFLGLSATPGRAKNAKITSEELAELFDHKKVTLDVGNNKNPINYLIEQGYIAHPIVVTKKFDGVLTKNDADKISKSLIDVPKEILEKLGKDSTRTLLTISQIEELIERQHKRIIAFAPSVKNSRDLAVILSYQGYVAYHVDEKTSSATRKKIIQEYQNDSNREIVLCNVGIFTTGFDAPKTSAVVIARPTKSTVLYSQMVGRAMRGPKVNGTKECEIRVITDTKISEFTDIANKFFEWEDVWN